MTEQFNKLRTDLRIAKPDDFYQQLIDAHAGLSDEESQKVNAKLVLILANHIGDTDVLREALQCAGRAEFNP
jgi:uncharacterized radical SAM superfamily protein